MILAGYNKPHIQTNTSSGSKTRLGEKTL